MPSIWHKSPLPSERSVSMLSEQIGNLLDGAFGVAKLKRKSCQGWESTPASPSPKGGGPVTADPVIDIDVFSPISVSGTLVACNYRASLFRIMDLRISKLRQLLFPSSGQRGRTMSNSGKTAKDVNQTDSAPKQTNQSRPTVTTSGQVIWSTRDLLFPSGHPRSTSGKSKK
jgi:hypothetical protein